MPSRPECFSDQRQFVRGYAAQIDRQTFLADTPNQRGIASAQLGIASFEFLLRSLP